MSLALNETNLLRNVGDNFRRNLVMCLIEKVARLGRTGGRTATVSDINTKDTLF